MWDQVLFVVIDKIVFHVFPGAAPLTGHIFQQRGFWRKLSVIIEPGYCFLLVNGDEALGWNRLQNLEMLIRPYNEQAIGNCHRVKSEMQAMI